MPLPVQAAEASKLIQMLAGGGGPPGGPPGAGPAAAPPGGAPPTPEGAALSGAVQQLDGANPQGISDMLSAMNADLAKAYLTAAQRVPNAAPHISKARDALQKAIQEVQKAAQVLSTVRPIANSAGVGPGVIQQGQQPDISALLGG
jgi:hypothetical protein